MESQPFSMPGARTAALACLQWLESEPLRGECASVSPRAALGAVVRALQPAPPQAGPAWVVQPAGSGPGQSSAWPWWLGAGQPPRPLLYLLRVRSVGSLQAGLAEAAGRGIFCNEAGAYASRWASGVQPSMPLWLAGRPDGTPYDPASGAEMLVLLQAAIRDLYLDGLVRFVYLSAHDRGVVGEWLSPRQARHAVLGMYRLRGLGRARPACLRLLGAGDALAEVRQAARLLRLQHGLEVEVWSCPSYTRLARDAEAVAGWNLLHPLARPRISHLGRCLGQGDAPVLAVTGYHAIVAGQIGAYVRAPFTALGSEDGAIPSPAPDARRIAAAALGLLGDRGAAAYSGRI